ncbi:MAG TPA: ATP-binding protein [Steroidobacter sp.]|uniref:sensor histidine kinase n=1 Tax=Steroidobacter sp. TaxID=1978227 RepID=UPI002ED89734
MITRLTFASRLGLIVVLSLIVAWIGSTAIFYIATGREDGESRPLPLPRQIAAIVQLLEQAKDSNERSLIIRAVSSQKFSVKLVSALPLLQTPEARPFELRARLLQKALGEIGGRPFSLTFDAQGGHDKRPPQFSYLSPTDLELRVRLSTGETLIIQGYHRPTTNVYGMPIGFIAGLVGTLTGLIALIIMHRQTRPLARLAARVDQIDFSGLPTQLPETRSAAPEIRQLIGAFNRLQSRLAQLLRARMAMLGGISHDVRTFATRLRLRVDHIPEGLDRERAIADIDDMIHLLDDALLASRAGAGELVEELVEFGQVVRAEVDDRSAEQAHVHLRSAARHEEAVVLGDRLALRRVVANLIDNALQYGKAAHVQVDATDKSVCLTVDDEGPGIPPEQRDAMLEPFVRLETSRNRRTGGAGLGLAVVRSLVEAHGGVVNISDAPTGGARFTVSLPLFHA